MIARIASESNVATAPNSSDRGPEQVLGRRSVQHLDRERLDGVLAVPVAARPHDDRLDAGRLQVSRRAHVALGLGLGPDREHVVAHQAADVVGHRLAAVGAAGEVRLLRHARQRGLAVDRGRPVGDLDR